MDNNKPTNITTFIYHHETSGDVATALLVWENNILYPVSSVAAVRWWEGLPVRGPVYTSDTTGLVVDVMREQHRARHVSTVRALHPTALVSRFDQWLESRRLDMGRYQGAARIREKIKRGLLDDAATLALLAGVYACQHSQGGAMSGAVSTAHLYELEQLWADIGL